MVPLALLFGTVLALPTLGFAYDFGGWWAVLAYCVIAAIIVGVFAVTRPRTRHNYPPPPMRGQ